MNCIKYLWEPAQSSEGVSCNHYLRQVGRGHATGVRGGLTLGSTAQALEAVVASQLFSPAGQAGKWPFRAQKAVSGSSCDKLACAVA